jgi:RNA polymerase sigma-70 factor (ECF subfamily)
MAQQKQHRAPAVRARQDGHDARGRDDKAAFEAAVEPYMETLLEGARKALAFYFAQGYLRPEDLSPEEIVGETLLYAWEHRGERPAPMSLRGWLLGTQYRVLRGLAERERAYRDDKAISLDEPFPLDGSAAPSTDHVQESFWEWHQPDAVTLWEEVTPAVEPVDIEIPLDVDHPTFAENPESYHVLMLHDEFEVPLPEVAFTMNQNLRDTAALLEEARASLRQYQAEFEPPGLTEADHPAPPDGSDE